MTEGTEHLLAQYYLYVVTNLCAMLQVSLLYSHCDCFFPCVLPHESSFSAIAVLLFLERLVAFII
jgi:hypothetical protein